MDAKITIIDYKPINQGALVAVFACRINATSMVLHGCKLFEKEGRRWIALPQSQYEKDGQTKYFPVVEIEDKELRKRFQRSGLEALDEHLKN